MQSIVTKLRALLNEAVIAMSRTDLAAARNIDVAAEALLPLDRSDDVWLLILGEAADVVRELAPQSGLIAELQTLIDDHRE